MSLDNTLWLGYMLAEAVVVALLFHRRVTRLLPLFFVYCIWDVCSNVFAFVIHTYYPSAYTTQNYLVMTAIDAVFQFTVLVELTLSVLRPIRASLPRYIPFAITAILLLAAAAIWPFSSLSGLAQYDLPQRLLGQLQQTLSILRIIFFLVLAGCSQWLSMGLRDRELQVATGLGFYSVVSLFIAMLATHQSTASQFYHLNRIEIAGFLCALFYWVYAFAQKEAERREFTPQMENLLLAVAGAARANRAALHDTSVTGSRRRDRE